MPRQTFDQTDFSEDQGQDDEPLVRLIERMVGDQREPGTGVLGLTLDQRLARAVPVSVRVSAGVALAVACVAGAVLVLTPAAHKEGERPSPTVVRSVPRPAPPPAAFVAIAPPQPSRPASPEIRPRAPRRPMVAKAEPRPAPSPAIVVPNGAPRLTGETLRLALIEDARRTRQLNETELGRLGGR